MERWRDGEKERKINKWRDGEMERMELKKKEGMDDRKTISFYMYCYVTSFQTRGRW